MSKSKQINPRLTAYKQWDDPKKINLINEMRKRYFFVDYYDLTKSSEELDDAVFKKISSQYISLDDYTKEKLLVNQMISNGLSIPEDIDRRLTITKHELESANLFSTFGRV